MNRLKCLFSEIKRQLLNIPLYEVEPEKGAIFDHEKMEYVNKQIEQSLASNPSRPIFLVGPFGSGKTTQLRYFFKKHPELHPRMHSFNKIKELDFAFANITKYGLRLIIVQLFCSFLVYLFYLNPQMGALPIAVVLGISYTKTLGNLLYLLHEIVDTAFRRSPQIIVLEDLERSSLKPEDQWALLTNLWNYQRIYLITFGYPPEKKTELFRFMEIALKLGGTFIEIPILEKAIYNFIKRIDPDFPFHLREKDAAENKGWLSLFTYREMLMLHEQVLLRLQKGDENATEKKLNYIEIGLEFLAEKLALAKSNLSFIRPSREIRGFAPEKYTHEQCHYLESFIESLEIPSRGESSERSPLQALQERSPESQSSRSS